MATFLILGAGMTGLTAARHLTRLGHTITVLDKGRGVGGRMATRRLAPNDQSRTRPDPTAGRADHGAPYFSVQTPAFAELVAELIGAGVVQLWPGQDQADTPADTGSGPAYVGIGGMNAVAKYLVNGLSVQTNCRAVRVVAGASGWVATTETGDRYEADALLLTLPVPQALTLLTDSSFPLDPADRAVLESVRYRPCLAVIVTLNQPTSLPAPGFIRFDDPVAPVALVVDNQQKGTSPDQPALTVYADTAYSLAHLEDDLEAVGRDLLAHLADLIPADSIATIQVHRWRYSTADRRLPERCRRLVAPFPLLIGGDAFGPGGVEGAFLSGQAISQSASPLPAAR